MSETGPQHPIKVPFDVSRDLVSFAGELSVGTLDNLRRYLGGSLRWAGERFQESSASPVAGGLGIAEGLAKTAEALSGAGEATGQGLAVAVEKTYEAFQVAFRSLNDAGEITRRTMFENVGVASVLGPSFDPLLKQEIVPSFRADGADCDVARVAADFRKSGCKEAIALVPGLFCDETIWLQPDPGTYHWANFFRERGLFPLLLRYHPGKHISENGRALVDLLDRFYSATKTPLSFMSYSQGGLVLRSALYYAREEKRAWRKNVRKALLVSSPDGGSYIEKVGFLVGSGLVAAPLLTLKLIGMVGNMRSDAMKDLSHGIIREEDWQRDGHAVRYLKDYYYGELDDVDAYQAYGIVSKPEAAPAWIGDGVVEHESIRLLSDPVYRVKPNPEGRVKALPGRSHFQTLQAPELREFAESVF